MEAVLQVLRDPIWGFIGGIIIPVILFLLSRKLDAARSKSDVNRSAPAIPNPKSEAIQVESKINLDTLKTTKQRSKVKSEVRTLHEIIKDIISDFRDMTFSNIILGLIPILGIIAYIYLTIKYYGVEDKAFWLIPLLALFTECISIFFICFFIIGKLSDEFNTEFILRKVALSIVTILGDFYYIHIQLLFAYLGNPNLKLSDIILTFLTTQLYLVILFCMIFGIWSIKPNFLINLCLTLAILFGVEILQTSILNILLFIPILNIFSNSIIMRSVILLIALWFFIMQLWIYPRWDRS